MNDFILTRFIPTQLGSHLQIALKTPMKFSMAQNINI